MKTLGEFLAILFPTTFLAAWGTGLIVSAMTDQWGLFLLSLVFSPAGVVYGVGIWCGVW